MKTGTVSQIIQANSENTKVRNKPKSALESIPAGTAFNQLWKTMMHSKESWQTLKTKPAKGEIEIPIAIQTKATTKTEAAGQTVKTHKTAESQKAKPTSVVKEPHVKALPEKVNNSAGGQANEKSAQIKNGQKAAQNVAAAGSEGTNKLSAGKVKQISARILGTLTKSHALPSVKAGDLAKVEVKLAGAQRIDSDKNEKIAKVPETRGVKPKTDGMKTASRKVTLLFKYNGKNGWRMIDKTAGSPKGQVWKVRLVFQDGENRTAQAVSGTVKNKAEAKSAAANKGLLVTVLSAKEVKKGTGQKARSQMTVKFAVENAGPGKNAAGTSSRGIQTVTFSLNDKTASNGTVNVEKAQVQSANNEPVPVTPGDSDEAGAFKGTLKKETDEVLAASVKKAGSAKQEEWTALSKNQLKTAEIAGKAMAKTKGVTTLSGRPSALIERIESLLAQAAKGKNSGQLKMQLTESPFGRLDVGFDDKENRLSIVVESEKAKEAFLRLTPIIQSSLADKGYLLNSVQVAVGESAARESRGKMSGKRNGKNSNVQHLHGKEGDDHEITTAVNVRKFGYNTLEVTA